MSKLGGIDKLADQAAESVRQSVYDTMEEEAIGDSPIERLLYVALAAKVFFGLGEHTAVSIIDNHVEPPDDVYKSTVIFVKRQVQLEGWRVDFVIYAYDHCGTVLKRPGWRQLIVECDGHDFHERTKHQAKRDRSRDRAALMSGRDIMRFTGSEIHNDPWGCAVQIVDWAAKSFG